MKYTFENIRKQGLLLYEYVRGSQAYGLSLPTSDEDTGGVFIMQHNDLLGLPSNIIDQVNDEKNDNVWYEIGKYVEYLPKLIQICWSHCLYQNIVLNMYILHFN